MRRILQAALLFALFVFLPEARSLAQTNAYKTITGIVYDESRVTLPGASVTVKNSQVRATTDNAGKFTINVPTGFTIIEVSYVGMTKVELNISSQSNVKVTLKLAANMLEEVVTKGYLTLTRRQVTGSVASISGEELLKTNPVNLVESLQGRLAGVQVNKGDGAPGAGISMLVRGANSFMGSEPLYVVDGVPLLSASNPAGAEGNSQTSNPLAYLNPQDIEDIQVLKDASETAIYGSRGANGVVVITTKKGKKGRDRIEFSANYSASKITRKVKMVDAPDFAAFQNEAYANATKYEGTAMQTPYPGKDMFSSTANKIVYFPSPEDYRTGLKNTLYPDGFTGTDWLNEILRTGSFRDYSLRFSGGDEKGNYSLSGNASNQDGIIKQTGFDRYGIQLNLQRNIGNFWQIGTNTNYTATNYQMGKTNTAGSQPNLIASTLFYPATQPAGYAVNVISEDILRNLNLFTPSSNIDGSLDITKTTRFFSSSYVQANISRKFNVRQRFGYNYNSNERSTYYDRTTGEGWSVNGRSSIAENFYSAVTSETILNYKNTFAKKHVLSAAAALSYEYNQEGNKTFRASNFPNDFTKYYNFGAGLNQSLPETNFGTYKMLSYLAKANYMFNNRYQLDVTFRADGTSKFGDANKFGYFPGISAGWILSNENFIQKLDVFSNLRLRASAGQTGNQGVGPYSTLYHMAIYNVPLNGALQSGMAYETGRGYLDPKLKWETTTQYNLGTDIGLMGNKITMTVEVYKKNTKDLLQNLKIANSTGFSTMLTNSGNIENKGLEVTVSAVLMQRANFKWGISNANISFNRNKITYLPYGDQYAQRLYSGLDNIFLQRVGQPIGTIYGNVEDGFYDNIAEVKADPQFSGYTDTQLLTKVGEIKYKNFDNDPTTIGTGDRQIIGNTNPDFTYGFSNDISFKKLNLSLVFQGVQGGDILNANLLKVGMSQVYNIPQFAYDTRWTPATAATAEWPKPLASSTRNFLFSDRYMEDASYFRLKSINVSYSFKVPSLKFIESINVFGSVTNVFTISKYRWFDPDVNSFGGDASRRGVDMYAYPNTRMYSLGIKATL